MADGRPRRNVKSGRKHIANHWSMLSRDYILSVTIRIGRLLRKLFPCPESTSSSPSTLPSPCPSPHQTPSYGHSAWFKGARTLGAFHERRYLPGQIFGAPDSCWGRFIPHSGEALRTKHSHLESGIVFRLCKERA
ncbi:uncharacterized protein EAE98_011614 [Botrytis deweyae]|uniref:Uncharacterized protein n=2 Tax=Botrytis TaxID=33196 RepID=A0A4Z1K9N6_9HELO|nr:uncharacterized protein EAE98_011614 [Botrytis deweyae]KAF7913389.1 hypothetical protein EAE98_011614 [Botrytis deweyae]KAF7917607.1 hypothetical protein EAE99_009273 [Botrytis elliptica]TGO77963.1 hypothetical protein BELL_0084g00180 [Botrytis elliptica]